MDLYTSKLEYIHLALCWFGHILGMRWAFFWTRFGHVLDTSRTCFLAQASGTYPIDRQSAEGPCMYICVMNAENIAE